MINVVCDNLAVATLNDTEKPMLFAYVRNVVEKYSRNKVYKFSTKVDNELQIRNVYLIGNLSIKEMKDFTKHLKKKINEKHLTWIRESYPDYAVE